MNVRPSQITGRAAADIMAFLNGSSMDSLLACLRWHEVCALVDAAEKIAMHSGASGIPAAAEPIDRAMRLRATMRTLEELASGVIKLETGTITP